MTIRRIQLPSQSTLNSLFFYNLSTGALVRVATNTVQHGKQVKIRGVNYYKHKIIWKMGTGEEPEFVDHIDRDHSNNVWTNLREADAQTNTYNADGHLGRDLPKNIVKLGRKFVVKMYGTPLGRYNTLEEAVIERNRLVSTLHGEFGVMI